MPHFETIQEIVLAAYQKMTPHVWDHVVGGAESETSLCRNRQALDSLALQPRVMRDVSKIDTSTSEIVAGDSGDFAEKFPGYTWSISTEEVSSELLGESAKDLKRIDILVSLNDSEYIYNVRTYRYMKE